MTGAPPRGAAVTARPGPTDNPPTDETSAGWRRGATPAAALAALIVLAVGLPLRLIALGTPFTAFHSWNEAHYTMIARNFAIAGPFAQFDTYGLDYTTSPVVPWLIAASMDIFGPHEWAARLPILLFGLATLPLFYTLARRLYGPGAALAALATAASAPGIVYFSRNVQLDGPLVACTLAAAVLLLALRRHGGRQRLAAFLGMLALAYLCKWIAVLFLPFLGALWVVPLGDGTPRRATTLGGVALTLLVPPLPAAAWVGWGLWQDPTYEDILLNFYFFRGNQWSWPGLLLALRASYNWLLIQFPVLLLLLLILGLPWIIHNWRRNLPALLLTGAALSQLRYPLAFRDNSYYLYPTLYGLALLCGGVVAAAPRTVASPGARRLVAVGMVTLVALATYYSVQNYRQYVRLVTSGTYPAVAAARQLATLRHPGESVLLDAPWLMYYAGGDPRALLDQPVPAACFPRDPLLESRYYRYVLYQGIPSEAQSRQMTQLGYRPLAGGILWQLRGKPVPSGRVRSWLPAPVSVVARICPWLASSSTRQP